MAAKSFLSRSCRGTSLWCANTRHTTSFPAGDEDRGLQRGRGKGDLLASRDWADIVALVDGREELGAEIQQAPADLVAYVSEAIQHLLAQDRILDGIRAQLLPDAISQSRAEDVVLTRLHQIIGHD